MAYKGHVAAIVAGQGGLNGALNQNLIPHYDLVEATNIRFDGRMWRKSPGMSLYNANGVANANAICLAGVDFWPGLSTQRQLTAWNDGKIYKEVSGDLDSVEVANVGAALTEPVVLLECGQELPGNNKKALFFCKGNAPRVLDGDGGAASMAAIAKPSPDWATTNQPAAAIMHDNRVWAWGNDNALHILYTSAVVDHADFLESYNASAGTGNLPPSYEVASGEGQRIACCASLQTTRLYIIKYPVGIYMMDTAAVPSYYLPLTTIRKDIGGAGPNGITRVSGFGTWFIGSDGHIYSLESLEHPDVDLKDASITGQLNLQDWITQNINPTYLKFARLLYDPQRKEVLAFYPKAAYTTNTIGLVFDVSNPEKVMIATLDMGSYLQAAWWMKQDTATRTLAVAGTGGKVYKMNQSARSVNGVAYNSILKTPSTDFAWLDPKLASYDKRFDWIELWIQTLGTYDVSVDVYIDEVYYATYTLDGATSGSLLGTGLVGSFLLGAITNLQRRKVKIGGVGEKLSLRLYNNNANEDFAVAKLLVSFQVLGTPGEK